MRAYRFACITGLGIVALAGPATADEARPPEPPLVASLQCDRAAEPGRVRCTVEARASAGRTLQWADVVLVSLPELTQALKGRLSPADRISRDAERERWAFALVAKKTGEAELKVRVRAVVCEGSRCVAAVVDAIATVRVG